MEGWQIQKFLRDRLQLKDQFTPQDQERPGLRGTFPRPEGVGFVSWA